MLRWYRQFARGGHTGLLTDNQPQTERHVRWAKTSVTAAVTTYPTSGNKLPVVLGKHIFNDTATGAEVPTFTAYDPPDERIALFASGYKAVGTIAQLTLHNGMWWEMVGASAILHFYTPVGGIPARVGTLLGSVSCVQWQVDSTLNLVATANSETVLNKSTTAIGGGSHISATWDDTGHLIAIWEDC